MIDETNNNLWVDTALELAEYVKDLSSVEESFTKHTDLLSGHIPYAAFGVQIPVGSDVFFVADIKQIISKKTLDMIEYQTRLSKDHTGKTHRLMFGEHLVTDTGIVAQKPSHTFRVRVGADSFDTDLVVVSTDSGALDEDHVNAASLICQSAVTLASVMCLSIRNTELRSEVERASLFDEELSPPIHRLNNALQTVTGYSEILLLKGPLTPEQQQRIEMIIKGAVEIKEQVAHINAVRRKHNNLGG